MRNAKESLQLFTGLALATLALLGCEPQQKSSASLTSDLKPTASIQDLMQHIVDPAADQLWESVEVTVTAKGEETKQPRSDEEWKAVRSFAVQLAEAGNLLAIERRPVAHRGKVLEDHHVQGILNAEQIQARIDADRPAFNARARALQQSAELALEAIDTRDVPKLIAVGARIDQACEQCHQTYWYPNDKRPTAFVAKDARPAQQH